MRRTLGRALAILLLTTAPAMADDEAAAIAAADRMVAATGAEKQARELLEQQIAYLMGRIQQANPNTPGRVFDILEEEYAAIGPDVVEEMVDYTARLYRERFTIDEMLAISAFFETDVGQKARRVMPALRTDGVRRGQEIGARLGQVAAERAMSRIRAEGIDFPPKR